MNFNKILFVILAISLSQITLANDIIISQVLYDPTGSESGQEAIELYNQGVNSLDVSGWIMITETSATDVTIPPNTVIAPGEHYLITDAGWSEAKEPGWPEAGHEEAMTLANTDSGIAVSNGTHVLDAVGWGDATSITDLLYEGIPHPGVESGNAILRRKVNGTYIDTNNNSYDFEQSFPKFNTNFIGGDVLVTITVIGTGPYIHNILLEDDDEFLPGNQINPVPKGNRTVTIQVIAGHSTALTELAEVYMIYNNKTIGLQKANDINDSTANYFANISFAYYEAPGNYTFNITAVDLKNKTYTFYEQLTYTKLVSLEVDAKSLQFSALPGQSSEIVGDFDDLTNNGTIINTGNSVLDLELSATDFTSSNGILGSENMRYSFDGNFNGPNSGTLNALGQIVQIGLLPKTVTPFSLSYNIPQTAVPGNYTGALSIIAVAR